MVDRPPLVMACPIRPVIVAPRGQRTRPSQCSPLPLRSLLKPARTAILLSRFSNCSRHYLPSIPGTSQSLAARCRAPMISPDAYSKSGAHPLGVGSPTARSFSISTDGMCAGHRQRSTSKMLQPMTRRTPPRGSCAASIGTLPWSESWRGSVRRALAWASAQNRPRPP